MNRRAIVVEDGLTGDNLVAVLMAFLDDRPPYLRINAGLLDAHQRRQVVTWARREIAEGRRVGILSTAALLMFGA